MVKDYGLERVSFDEALARVSLTGKKLQTTKYRDSGRYPVIDQGQTVIAAFTDDGGMLQIPPPDGFIVFGDHTRVVKHVSFPFVVGADGVQLLRSREGFDARYLALCLLSADIPDTGYNRHFKFLKEIDFCVPPLNEQVAIAEALSDADALVESLNDLIAKKHDIKRAAMQQLLTGRTRFPGFSDDWQEYKIGDFTDCRAGGTPSTEIPEYWGGPIRWMSSGELNYRRVSEVSGRITDLGLANSSAQMFPAMSVLIGLAGQGRTRGTSAINLVPLSTNQSIAAIFPSAFHDSRFLYYVMDTKYDELRGLSDGGGGRGGLNLSIIRSVSVRMPALDQQVRIADVLWNMDAEIDALVAQRDKTELVKQGMMQELLSGRVRLV